MKTSETLMELAHALVAAQSEMPGIDKDGKGYNYRYATLDNIMTKIRPVLSANGLAVIQMTTGVDGIGLTTRLIHESGEWIEDTIYAPPDESQTRSSIQSAGSTITYLRRYGIAALLGLADETDTDGIRESSNGQKAEPPPSKQDIKPPMPTDVMKKKFHMLGSKLYGDEWDDKRPQLVTAVTHGRAISSNDLYRAEMQHLIDGMEEKLNAKEAADA